MTRRREALGLPSYVDNNNEDNVHAENVGLVKYQTQPELKTAEFNQKYFKAQRDISNTRKQIIKRCEKVIENDTFSVVVDASCEFFVI